MPKHFPQRVLACCILAALAGCHSSPSTDTTEVEERDPGVPAPPEGVKVVVGQDKQVRVLSPTVEFDTGIMNISGYVRRRPGTRGVLTGRIDIDVLDADGASLDWIPALLVPGSIPTEGKGESGYVIHYGWIPPTGSTIKVRFVDTKTALLEDTGDYDTVGGSYGSHNGGGAGGTHRMR
jgi:hypothetical protein